MKGEPFLIQQFMPEIATQGEISFIYIDGSVQPRGVEAGGRRRLSRAKRFWRQRRGCLLPSAASGAGKCKVQAVPQVRDSLYCRIDAVERDGKLLLMELELIEPELFLGLAEGSAERFAGRNHQKNAMTLDPELAYSRNSNPADLIPSTTCSRVCVTSSAVSVRSSAPRVRRKETLFLSGGRGKISKNCSDTRLPRQSCRNLFSRSATSSCVPATIERSKLLVGKRRSGRYGCRCDGSSLQSVKIKIKDGGAATVEKRQGAARRDSPRAGRRLQHEQRARDACFCHGAFAGTTLQPAARYCATRFISSRFAPLVSRP